MTLSGVASHRPGGRRPSADALVRRAAQFLRTGCPQRAEISAVFSRRQSRVAELPSKSSGPELCRALHQPRACLHASGRRRSSASRRFPSCIEVDVSYGTPRLHDGRPAGRQRPRKPRPCPQRYSQFRLRVSQAPHHREPGARRHAQGGRGLRSADRARRPGGDGPGAAARRRRRGDRGGVVARRRHSAGARRAADRRGGAQAARAGPAAAARQRPGSRGGRRAARSFRSGLAGRRRRRAGTIRGPVRRWPRSRRGRRRKTCTAISPTCAASSWRGARSRSPRRAATTCCSRDRPDPARR